MRKGYKLVLLGEKTESKSAKSTQDPKGLLPKGR